MIEENGLPAANPRLLALLAELKQRELAFQHPSDGTTRAHFDAMTESDFWEIGASGRCYSRDQVLDVLEERMRQPIQQDPWRTDDFRCRVLGPDTFLLTYSLWQGMRRTRRATIWRRKKDGWVVLYHQGTLVSDS